MADVAQITGPIRDRTLAFVGFGEAGPQVWVQALDALEAHRLQLPKGQEGCAGRRTGDL